MIRTPLAALLGAIAAFTIAVSQPVIHAAPLPDVLRASIAAYSALTSYADTGRIRQEVPGIVDESRFVTYFRRPTRDLYFDFQALTSTNPANRFTIDMSGYRFVIWMVKGTMQTYDRAARSLAPVAAANGGQTRALQALAHATAGTSILVPSLLYSQAGLPGTIREMSDATLAGVESLDGHRCQKVVGMAVVVLPSGKKANERQVTVWIDAESRLVRRVVEETAATKVRLTITLDPRANPTIEDAMFQFQPPRSSP